MRKSGDMICDQVRILNQLFLYDERYSVTILKKWVLIETF